VISDDGRIADRYDKRLCSHTEITHYYSPGLHPVVFDVDGVRFGCAICIEVNFPDVFAEYERLGVDCLLLSAYPVDSVFAIKARAHAAINNYWIGLSAPAQTRELFPSALIGPDGEPIAQVSPDDELVIAEIDRADPAFHVALDLARPWRRRVRSGEIYAERAVTDPRSADRTTR
jgi:predicted amidohydrolase